MKRILLLLLLCSAEVFAAESVRVSNSWARATAPGQDVAGAYLEIESDRDAKLVKMASPVAREVVVHSMSIKDGMMEMRQLKELELPAGKTVKLAPGSLHLMLIGLKQPLAAGTRVPLDLEIENKDRSLTRLKVEAEVRPLGN